MTEHEHDMILTPDPTTVPDGTLIALHCANCDFVSPVSPLWFTPPREGAKKVYFATVPRDSE